MRSCLPELRMPWSCQESSLPRRIPAITIDECISVWSSLVSLASYSREEGRWTLQRKDKTDSWEPYVWITGLEIVILFDLLCFTSWLRILDYRAAMKYLWIKLWEVILLTVAIDLARTRIYFFMLLYFTPWLRTLGYQEATKNLNGLNCEKVLLRGLEP